MPAQNNQSLDQMCNLGHVPRNIVALQTYRNTLDWLTEQKGQSYIPNDQTSLYFNQVLLLKSQVLINQFENWKQSIILT